jgi:hypothetical protein
MLEVNGCNFFIEMGKTSGPAEAECLLYYFFLPLCKLLDIVDRFAPEIGGRSSIMRWTVSADVIMNQNYIVFYA